MLYALIILELGFSNAYGTSLLFSPKCIVFSPSDSMNNGAFENEVVSYCFLGVENPITVMSGTGDIGIPQCGSPPKLIKLEPRGL